MKHTNIKLALFALIISLFTISNAAATQTDIVGPAGSGQFGKIVLTLSNGNVVIIDSLYDAPGPITDVGAVYLYNGATGALISALTGGAANDRIGEYGSIALSNGNFVVGSPSWDNPSLVTNNNVGAVTWCSGTTGCSGAVSTSNSLVGITAGDLIGSIGITALPNGNYVVRSPNWDDPTTLITNVGAVTWCNGADGKIGQVSASNSLIGSSADDVVGRYDVIVLANSNYVVSNLEWNNPSPGISDVGAVTWCSGSGSTNALVSASNSLIGSSPFDYIGYQGVIPLTNGNYVVDSANWDNTSSKIANVGAVTWGNGTGGTVGVITESNSLIGRLDGDGIGNSGVVVLTNGNYVVRSPFWDNPSLASGRFAGAATWGNGAVGTVGIVSASNSLIGGSAGDYISSHGITALSNGSFVVKSFGWDNPSPAIVDVGAVTWGSGTGETIGVVSASNSLIGSSTHDFLLYETVVTALTNGNYVLGCKGWDNPALAANNDAGAATWGNGAGGTVGVISASNSLIGGTAGDNIGDRIAALSNGNYVVGSPRWNNPLLAAYNNVGAATWGNGNGGTVGLVSASNSLIGGTTGDNVGSYPIQPLTNGNYVVNSPLWGNPSPLITDVGAVTWGNGTSGTVGIVNAGNSLIGGMKGEKVGYQGVKPLTNGNYVVISTSWSNPSLMIYGVGAVTWGNGAGGTVGLVSASNSLVGGTNSDNIGYYGVFPLPNGNYVVNSPYWDNPTSNVVDAGAISFGSGVGGTVGLISANNSVRGTTANGGFTLNFAFDAVNNQLVVGRPVANIVTLFKPTATPKSNKRIRIFL